VLVIIVEEAEAEDEVPMIKEARRDS